MQHTQTFMYQLQLTFRIHWLRHQSQRQVISADVDCIIGAFPNRIISPGYYYSHWSLEIEFLKQTNSCLLRK